MNRNRVAPLLALLFLLVGLADASAQAFFPSRIDGTNEVRFTSNISGVQVAVDNQPAGAIPLTIYVLPGPHRFTFTAPGAEPKTIVYPVQADVEVPFFSTPKKFPLTVNTNVPAASFAIDGAFFPGQSTSITPGNHTLTVSAPGYQTLSIPFVQPSQQNILNITLVASNGTVVVNTERLFKAGATYKIFVNGAETASNVQSLPPGSYTIRVVSGSLTIETSVAVASGQTLTLTPTVQWDIR